MTADSRRFLDLSRMRLVVVEALDLGLHTQMPCDPLSVISGAVWSTDAMADAEMKKRVVGEET